MADSYIGLAGDCEHNSSVVLIEDGLVKYAESEERLSGIKGDGRFPKTVLSVAQKLATYPITYCIAGLTQSVNKARTDIRCAKGSEYWRYNISQLAKSSQRCEFIEHHTAHNGSFYLTELENALAVTADGQGDGLSFTVNQCADDLVRIAETQSDLGSPGFLYAAVTKYLGYKPLSGEGKITALAGRGKTRKPLQNLFEKIFYTDKNKNLQVNSHFINGYSRNGTLWSSEFDKICKNHNPEDIAYALQTRFEDVLVDVIKYWLNQTSERNLFVSGGVFANVTLNRRLQELPLVNQLYVTPWMADEGTAMGAAALIYYKDTKNRVTHPQNAFLGSETRFPKNTSSLIEIIGEVEKKIAEILSKRHLVARVCGKMEFGPRALGNHSILYHPSDKNTIHWLNKRLGRSSVMPFAPVISYEDANRYLFLNNSTTLNYEFMTTSLRVKDEMKKNCEGVVHADGTVRPQIVKADNNPSLHKIIREFKAITGLSSLLNTSFNLHGQPIISDPDVAIEICKCAGIKYLQLGDKLYEVKL